MRKLNPHAKPHLTSWAGRVVDRAGYIDLIIFAALVLLASSIYFWLAPPLQGIGNGNGNRTGVNFADSLYFSFVTFTSLGYGDFSPKGFGRLVAVGNVLWGLGLTAVLIGKLASERQSALLMLVHTSDTQRRIVSFVEELGSLRRAVERQVREKDSPGLRQTLDEQARISRASRNFLVFNSHQAAVLELGNFTALKALYDEIEASFGCLYDLHGRSAELGDAETMGRLLLNLQDLRRTIQRMAELHRHRRREGTIVGGLLSTVGLAKGFQPTALERSTLAAIDQLETEMDRRLVRAKAWTDTGFHPLQTERVFKAFPSVPRAEWPAGVTKVVAQQLGISNNVAGRCVEALLLAGRLPKSRRQRAKGQ